MDSDMISDDAKNRIYYYQTHQQSPVGAYTTNSKGWTYTREAVANFIAKRDGFYHVNPDHIFIGNGASEGCRAALQMAIRDGNDGVLVPIPQYPLYSALLTLLQGHLIPYYLDEELNWGLDPEHLDQQIEIAKRDGICPRAMVIINPGNPTGQVLTYKTIQDIIKVCHKHEIMIIADEVYQTNIYKRKGVFVSVRRVLAELGKPYDKDVELISLNSVSKGMLGECGFRGGYYECHNLPPEALELVFKLKSMDLCGNTIGQTSIELMCNPPRLGVESADCVNQY
jgi:aspartate/methionine/tyrosine aminotransferase